MEVLFSNDDLEKLEWDANFTARLPQAVVRSYREAMQHIRAAVDERDLRYPGFHLEKLRGKRRGQHSMMLNDQYRLIIELPRRSEKKTIRVIEVTDYH